MEALLHAAAIHDAIVYALLWKRDGFADEEAEWGKMSRLNLRGIWDALMQDTEDAPQEGPPSAAARLDLLENRLVQVVVKARPGLRQVIDLLFGAFRRYVQQNHFQVEASEHGTRIIATRRFGLQSGSRQRIVAGLDWVVLEVPAGKSRADLERAGFAVDSLVKTETKGNWKVCLGPGSLQRRACERCFYTTAFDSPNNEGLFLCTTWATWALQKDEEVLTLGGPDHQSNLLQYTVPDQPTDSRRTLSLCDNWEDLPPTVASPSIGRPVPTESSILATSQDAYTDRTSSPVPSDRSDSLTPPPSESSADSHNGHSTWGFRTPSSSPRPESLHVSKKARLGRRRVQSSSAEPPPYDPSLVDKELPDSSDFDATHRTGQSDTPPSTSALALSLFSENSPFSPVEPVYVQATANSEATKASSGGLYIDSNTPADGIWESVPPTDLFPLHQGGKTERSDDYDDLDILDTPPRQSFRHIALESDIKLSPVSNPEPPISLVKPKRKKRASHRPNALLRLHRELSVKIVQSRRRLQTAKDRIAKLELGKPAVTGADEDKILPSISPCGPPSSSPESEVKASNPSPKGEDRWLAEPDLVLDSAGSAVATEQAQSHRCIDSDQIAELETENRHLKVQAVILDAAVKDALHKLEQQTGMVKELQQVVDSKEFLVKQCQSDMLQCRRERNWAMVRVGEMQREVQLATAAGETRQVKQSSHAGPRPPIPPPTRSTSLQPTQQTSTSRLPASTGLFHAPPPAPSAVPLQPPQAQTAQSLPRGKDSRSAASTQPGLAAGQVLFKQHHADLRRRVKSTSAQTAAGRSSSSSGAQLRAGQDIRFAPPSKTYPNINRLATVQPQPPGQPTIMPTPYIYQQPTPPPSASSQMAIQYTSPFSYAAHKGAPAQSNPVASGAQYPGNTFVPFLHPIDLASYDPQAAPAGHSVCASQPQPNQVSPHWTIGNVHLGARGETLAVPFKQTESQQES